MAGRWRACYRLRIAVPSAAADLPFINESRPTPSGVGHPSKRSVEQE
jgi:hypothetical protein